MEAIGKVLGPQRLRVPYPLTHDELLKTNHYFKGIKVLAEYRGSHKRQWKVATVTSTPAASTMFSLHSTERGLQHISVAEYFWKQYNIRLNFPHLPCLVVGDPAKKIYLPMEVCRIIPGQKYPYKLDELQTKDLIKHASLPPWLRSASIQKGYHNLFPDGDEYLKSFKIGIEPKMIETPARLLDPPSVRFLEAPAVLPYNGGWTMTTQKLVQPSQLVSMAVLSFCSETHMSLNCLYTFCNQFMLAAEAVGIQVGSVQPIIRYCNPRLDSVENGFNKTIQRVLETCGEYPKLLFCILPNSKNDLYAHIKYVGDTKFGIATQCILAKSELL